MNECTKEDLNAGLLAIETRFTKLEGAVRLSAAELKWEIVKWAAAMVLLQISLLAALVLMLVELS